VKPDTVPGLKVRDLCDGEGDAVAADADIDARTDEVKARIDSEARPTEAEEKGTENEQTDALRHALSLDALKASVLASQVSGQNQWQGGRFLIT